MAKIHLRANKLTGNNAPIATCAARMSSPGKVKFNTRRTYRFMASEIVSRAEFAAVADKDRCAHCMDMGLKLRNAMRKAEGLAPLSSIFEGV